MKEKNERELLEEINEKMTYLILINSIQGKNEKDKIKFLKSYSKKSGLSKREVENITGIDRHKF